MTRTYTSDGKPATTSLSAPVCLALGRPAATELVTRWGVGTRCQQGQDGRLRATTQAEGRLSSPGMEEQLCVALA